MRVSLKVTVTLLIVVAGFSALDRFLHWMNQASDLRLYSGLVGTISLFVLVPALLSALWSWGKRRM